MMMAIAGVYLQQARKGDDGMDFYLYETQLHTYPVSKCAKASVRQALEFYKGQGYAGVFITNHFIDGNINCDRTLPYEDRIRFYFSDYEQGVEIGKELGIAVFSGLECACPGAHFLVYGLDKEWFLAHPEMDRLGIVGRLNLMREHGALIIQAHPYRDTGHISLFPKHVHGTEIYNADDSEHDNDLARAYADAYGLIPFAGSDNHTGPRAEALGGMQAKQPIRDEQDFIQRVLKGEMAPFCRRNDLTAGADCDTIR